MRDAMRCPSSIHIRRLVPASAVNWLADVGLPRPPRGIQQHVVHRQEETAAALGHAACQHVTSARSQDRLVAVLNSSVWPDWQETGRALGQHETGCVLLTPRHLRDRQGDPTPMAV